MTRILMLIFSFFISGFVSAQNGFYPSVLKIPSLDSSPDYLYINTNIPAADAPAPQLRITGYNYSDPTNKAVDITLGWYHYNGSFYWTQYNSNLGYAKPNRIRLGKYVNGSGITCIRIELANNGVYWSHYNIGAMDRSGFPDYYSGWTYSVGEMPAGTTEITNVPLQANMAIQGKLSIGNGAVVPDNYLLAVKGKVIAEELKIQAIGNWPDYVFDSSYQLMSLRETDLYIKTNKHLPGIPSASQVQKDGVEIGTHQALLLQKIEELTLHLIQLEKKVTQQNEQIQRQQEIITKVTSTKNKQSTKAHLKGN